MKTLDSYFCCNNLDRVVAGKPIAYFEGGTFYKVTIQVFNFREECRATLARIEAPTEKLVLSRAKAVLPILGAQWDREHPTRCYRCERIITRRATWLELNCHTGAWTTPDKPWKTEESQGSFPFGPDCVAPALAGKEYHGPKNR